MPILSGVKAKPLQFIALIGYAGAGKDVFAKHLLDAGYVRHNYGDLIKQFFDDFTQRRMGPSELKDQILLHLDPNKTEQDVHEFFAAHILPYYENGYEISAFTENRGTKHHIREILEKGGELIYAHIQREYTDQLDSLLRHGHKVVNTRMCQIPEAKAAAQYGVTSYLIEREAWPPATDWDAQVVDDLADGGFIHHTVYNDAPDAQGWEELSREYVRHNILKLELDSGVTTERDAA